MIKGLEKFVFTKENMNILMNKAPKLKLPISSIFKPLNKKVEKIYIPQYKDTLFWCYYIIMNGIISYKYMVQSSFKIEKDTKINFITKVRENKPLLKKLKIKWREIENNLLNEETLSINSFFILCILSKLNILIKDRFLYMNYFHDCSNPKHIIEINDGKFGLYQGNVEEYYKLCQDKFWEVDNILKPLRVFSFYKLKDLQDICKCLNINIETEGKRRKKKEMYEDICLKIKN